jgi:hypothetical protein
MPWESAHLQRVTSRRGAEVVPRVQQPTYLNQFLGGGQPFVGISAMRGMRGSLVLRRRSLSGLIHGFY